ncbi:MAG: hypothetical protein V4505_00635 [Pseudomonadota bacterium]
MEKNSDSGAALSPEESKEFNVPSRFFTVRVSLTHPTVSAKRITEFLGEPDFSSSVEESGRSFTRWSVLSWTRGDHVGEEIEEIIEWLEGKPELIGDFCATGGEIIVSINFLGKLYFSSTLRVEILARAVAMGVNIRHAVYPYLRWPDD